MQMTRFCAIEVIGEPCQRSIGLWWDILVIAVFSLVICYWAQAVHGPFGRGDPPKRPAHVSLQPHRRRGAEDGRR